MMSTSYTISSTPLVGVGAQLRPVLITGAAGRIGRSLSEYAASKYRLRLAVRHTEQRQELKGSGEVVVADLTDAEAACELCMGIDTVVHLAANASPAANWASLLPDNIIATRNVLTVAVRQKCLKLK